MLPTECTRQDCLVIMHEQRKTSSNSLRMKFIIQQIAADFQALAQLGESYQKERRCQDSPRQGSWSQVIQFPCDEGGRE